MRTLALETTEMVGSLALLADSELIASRQLPAGQRTAATFAIGMKELLAEADWRPNDLGLIAVCSGPGSFTGLRIGVTAAKTLAYATGAAIVAVNTLEVIALGAGLETERLWVVMNAFRSQVFAAQFDTSGNELSTLIETQILDAESWLGRLQAGDVVSGPMLSKLSDRVPEGITIGDPARWSPTAANVGRWGFHRYQQGQRDDLWQLAPNYFRKSAAEEQLEQRD